jgi:hypothetical protein
MSAEHWWDDTDREKPKYLERNLSQRHFVHKESQTEWPGIEAGPRDERRATNRLNHGTTALTTQPDLYLTL